MSSRTSIPDYSSAKVLVLGDVMLDRYWSGSTSRVSPEAPVPVVLHGKERDCLGGAGNVAANIAALGGQVGLMGAVGADRAADELEAFLAEQGVKAHLQRVQGYPTTVKLRVLSRNQQLVRIDFEDTAMPVPHEAMLESFKQVLPKYNLVVLSDYAKGVLGDPQPYIEAARAAGMAILVDPKGSDFEKYRGATLLTPNRGEFEAVVGPAGGDESIVAKAEQLVADCGLDMLLVTRSEEGMSLVQPTEKPLHIPTHAQDVFDVTGAGDTVIGTLAAGMSANVPVKDAVRFANLAASVAVAKIGAVQVTPAQLRRAAHKTWGSPNGVVSKEELVEKIEDARAHGERVVFTNGCFDLLHPGHVAYLEQAKSLGDRLIVAVNTSDSVSRLKGPTRPINDTTQRMAVLAGLASVDWVVPFGEDTPAEIIAELLPDVLVKGGDYKPDEIVGADTVIANGGQVEVLQFLAGYSTTTMVERILSGGK
jgi:D-beta-D-heptose 7-phosphate kinase/D-beta-D-heptose 1-phosphate adenosyltransferase